MMRRLFLVLGLSVLSGCVAEAGGGMEGDTAGQESDEVAGEAASPDTIPPDPPTQPCPSCVGIGVEVPSVSPCTGLDPITTSGTSAATVERSRGHAANGNIGYSRPR